MPRFKDYSYDQSVMLAISFDRQILPGSFEHSLTYLIENELDLSIFDHCYQNDDNGRPAYDPAILLKIIFLAYSRGMISSRKIEQLCRENILFLFNSMGYRLTYWHWRKPHSTSGLNKANPSNKITISRLGGLLVFRPTKALIL